MKKLLLLCLLLFSGFANAQYSINTSPSTQTINAKFGSPVASASTITPTGNVFHVTGTTSIDTISLPPGCVSGVSCTITIIPDASFATTTAGNIIKVITTVINQALIITYDPGTAKWYPSYTAPAAAIFFQTNGTANGSQLGLNLVAGAGVVLTNSSSSTTVAAAIPTFQTNTANNIAQNLLNLVGSNGVATNNSAGGLVQITNTAPGATLKTNGTNNSSQAILNIAASSGISATDGGTGTVTLANTSLGGTLASGNVAFDTSGMSGAGAGATLTSISGLDGNFYIEMVAGTGALVNRPIFTVTFTASRGHVSYCTIQNALFSGSDVIEHLPGIIPTASATLMTSSIIPSSNALIAGNTYAFNVICP